MTTSNETLARWLLAAVLLAASTPALAHQFACDVTMGEVQTDASGAPVIGDDGLPVMTPGSVAAGWIHHYPVTLGFRATFRNTAAEPSIPLDAWSSLLGRPNVSFVGQALPLGHPIPVGGSGTTFAVATIHDQAECLALGGFGPVPETLRDTPACQTGMFQVRFSVTHDAGSTECRHWIWCDRDLNPPPPAPLTGPSPWTTMASGTTESLTGVWGSGPDDVWIVGQNGTILRWDGQAIAPVASGTSADLRGVWGTSATDVWAAGAGVVLHWDGHAWSQSLSFQGGTYPNSVGGSGPDDVWVATDQDLWHWDGAQWKDVVLGEQPSGLAGVWANSASDAWVGAWGQLFHFNGAAWTSVLLPHTFMANDIWGLPSGELFVAGDNELYRLVPGQPVMTTETPNEQLLGIWGTSADDVWAVGGDRWWLADLRHWDGTGWTQVPAPDPFALALFSVWGSAANDMWAVGPRGTIIRLH